MQHGEQNNFPLRRCGVKSAASGKVILSGSEHGQCLAVAAAAFVVVPQPFDGLREELDIEDGPHQVVVREAPAQGDDEL